MREKTEKSGSSGRRAWIIAAGVLLWLILMAALALLLDARTVRFYIYGEDEITLEYGTPYVEPGFYAVTTGRLFGESEKHLEVETLGEVDTGRLGSYVLRYVTHFAFSEYAAERRVNVVDTTPPVIELKHIEGYEPTWMTGYAEEGYTAYDACDGDLTGRVLREPTEDGVRYTVSDASGNTTSVERLLPKINYEPPVITLLGGEALTVEAGLQFTDPGCTAVDNLGNDWTDYVVVDGEVVPWLAGTYELYYTITSERGEDVTAVRTVTVTPAELPEAVVPKEKTIYLTFDDGPGPYTEELLSILDRYKVKATFFVTAQEPEYFDLIGKAFRAGHSIGVHTSTHDYDRIYSSEQAFFEDFFNMEEIIREQTGEYTRLFRFPGGSSNTVSRINEGIMTRLTQAMTDMGYQYFDWNVVSGDAGETKKTKKIIENIEEGCKEHTVSVILQHDIKDYSVAAVEPVIQWGLANGYTFRALQLDSPSMHHSLNN